MITSRYQKQGDGASGLVGGGLGKKLAINIGGGGAVITLAEGKRTPIKTGN